jgi:hypothetical protein
MLCSIAGKAQIATQNSNALDNIYVGVTGGVSTPLDFNSIFPLNTNAGVVIGKDFTPFFGLNVEGLAFLNDNHFSDAKTAVKATNLSLNGVVNLNNVFFGYKGTPRVFEISTVTGFGWLHEWQNTANYLTAKTGLNFAFNLGKKKAHSIIITPAVYWNLNKYDNIKFNKNGSQLALSLTYVYHFKTSNGTHSFKTYDIGAMIGEIDRLNGALAECEKRPAQVVEKVIVKEAPVNTAAVAEVVKNDAFVFFAQNSSVLTDDAKYTLDKVTGTVDVIASASPEGTEQYNQKLSEKRAAVVADYLTKRGVTVNSWKGIGVTGAESGRVAIVKSTR